MIVLDTETTGLIKNATLPLEQQPEIIEFAAVKLDAELAETSHIHFLIKPKNLVHEETIKKSHGITNEMLEGKPSFARVLPAIQSFFLGEDTLVAHHPSFDTGVLSFELRRLDRLTKFPWPPNQVDTVEMTRDIQYKRKQEALVKTIKGEAPKVAHRALEDVRELCDILRYLRQLDGRI